MNKEHENLCPLSNPYPLLAGHFSPAQSYSRGNPDVFASVNFCGVVSKALVYSCSATLKFLFSEF